ncbi:MAG TPA: hypothetical protein VNT20_10360 [Flavisolibacter sp.]|jgi:hypothetical protein|nr:hypothetical protein [Flavisolibacter sp.]
MPGNQIQHEEEISLKELVVKIKAIWTYLLKKWVFILLAVIVGAGIGFVYARSQPIKYESRLSFVLEEGKAGVGGLASLAGQFGFDLGGGSAGGVFSGDNILLFLKSQNLCREVLLTDYDSAGKTLADKYAECNELKSSWAKNKGIGDVNFSNYKAQTYSRLADSLLQGIVNRILKKELSVSKPDKKASFIEVTALMRDELLSKYFIERLVKIATDRYVESKTKLKSQNVAKLQRRADSLGALLNNRTYSVAAEQQNLVDLNPALKMASVSTEITSRDKTMIATIFAEVVKNLEIAKVTLTQETPTIQVVDTPILPLKKEKTSKLLYLLLGGAILGLAVVFFYLVKKQLQ